MNAFSVVTVYNHSKWRFAVFFEFQLKNFLLMSKGMFSILKFFFFLLLIKSLFAWFLFYGSNEHFAWSDKFLFEKSTVIPLCNNLNETRHQRHLKRILIRKKYSWKTIFQNDVCTWLDFYFRVCIAYPCFVFYTTNMK